MTASARVIAALRPATFVAGGAFAVHELSYLVGQGAGGSYAAGGHSYLAALLPALAALVALTLLATVESGVAGMRAHRAMPLRRVVANGGVILALFCVQEAAEGLLAGGEPVRIALALASAGFVAAPLSLTFGFLAWLAARGLEAIEDRIAIRFERPVRRGAASFGLRPRWLDLVLSPALVAGGASPRAPPSSV